MRATIVAILMLGACNGSAVENPEGVNEVEVITTVGLAFTPHSGGAAIEAKWSDPENDGSPVIDDIVLSDADDYDVAVTFLNEVADPVDDITVEVGEENDVHQVFFLGSAVEGPSTGANPAAVVTQAYSDTDANGNPLGLANVFTTVAPGSGELEVVLRHMADEEGGGESLKVAGLTDVVASEGIAALPGDSDADVTFDLTVE